MNNSLLQINSPQSSILGIFLLLGVYIFGKFLWKKFIKINLNYEFCQYAFFGLIVISFILYPIFLFNFYTSIISKFISYGLLLLGLLQLFFLFKKIKLTKFNLHLIEKKYYILFLLLIGFLLISLSPSTNADSLDYHYGIASFINFYGYYPNSAELTWIHGHLGGIFESTISLGLKIGSDSFGSLHQFVALLSIFGTIMGVKKKNHFINKEFFYLSICILAITPLVFLFSSVKPQLIGVASNLFAINLIFQSKKNNSSKREINIFLILFLLVFSFLVKFTFIISCSLIFIYLFYRCYNLKKIKKLLSYTFILFLLLVLPVWYWKIVNLNFSFIELIFSPLPLSNGSFSDFLDYMLLHNEFNYHLGFKEYKDKIIFLKIFPLFLLFPSDLSKITTFIGVPLVFLFLYKKNKNKEIYELKYLVILIYIFISILSSPNSRYYLLVYYLGIYHLAVVGIDFKNKFFYLISKLVKIQLIAVLIIVFYGVYILSPGIINNKYRNEVLNNHAIYYNISIFAKKNLPNQTKIINDFRSTALFKFPQVRTDWININSLDFDKLENRDKFNYHLEKIIEFNPKYLITRENSKTYSYLKNCLILEYSKDNLKIVKRNPFGKEKYINVRIYKINELKKCLKK